MNINDFNAKEREAMVKRLMETKFAMAPQANYDEEPLELLQEHLITESVLDPIQKYRCEALFGPNNKEKSPKLKPETRQFILNIAKNL